MSVSTGFNYLELFGLVEMRNGVRALFQLHYSGKVDTLAKNRPKGNVSINAVKWVEASIRPETANPVRERVSEKREPYYF